MPQIREEVGILGIIAADWQTEQLCQLPCLMVYPVDNHAVIPCIGADDIIIIRGEVQGAGSGTCGMVVIQSGYGLDFLKLRIPFHLFITVYINDIFKLDRKSVV